MKPLIPPLALFAAALCSVPAWGTPILFSDLGTGPSVYNTAANSWGIEGSNNTFSPGIPQGIAMLFTVAGTGTEAVTQIDLAMWHFGGATTFTASLWTDVSSHPGSQVALFGTLSTNNLYPACCALATVTGISGVTVTGGQQYFMVLQPVSYSDTSTNGWAYNTQGVSGDYQSSQNGATWIDGGISANYAAFDVLSTSATPEPAALMLCGASLAALAAFRRRERTRL